MTTRPPAEIGMSLDEVDTPALLVDLDAFDWNLERMARLGKQYGIHLRPHGKTHKCPTIARLQIARGAIGVCCQKVGEAEVMVEAGIDDVYVSNEIVGRRKVDRLAALARRAKMSVAVDHEGQIGPLGEAAQRFGVELGVRVEIIVGGRCGVPPGAAAVPLAQQVARTKGLRFEGLQAYNGRGQHIADYAERMKGIQLTIAQARETRDLLARAGLACTYIGGAGTGTYDVEGQSGVFNELQVGSYLFMDAAYETNKKADGTTFDDWKRSLYVYGTVMSRPEPNRAVTDVGTKAVSIDSGPPILVGNARAEWRRGGDEHCSFVYEDPEATPALGTKLKLFPGHCDPTINMYDWFVGYRGRRVEALWPISARGAIT